MDTFSDMILIVELSKMLPFKSPFSFEYPMLQFLKVEFRIFTSGFKKVSSK